MDDATSYGPGMVAALRLPPHAMTVVAFLEWNPDDGSGGVLQLRDGEPEMMAPASDVMEASRANSAACFGIICWQAAGHAVS